MSISYSSNNGKYQTEVNKLQELIPKYGSCDNVFLEQLRIIIRIYYGLNNNGDFSAAPSLRSLPRARVLA